MHFRSNMKMLPRDTRRNSSAALFLVSGCAGNPNPPAARISAGGSKNPDKVTTTITAAALVVAVNLHESPIILPLAFRRARFSSSRLSPLSFHFSLRVFAYPPPSAALVLRSLHGVYRFSSIMPPLAKSVFVMLMRSMIIFMGLSLFLFNFAITRSFAARVRNDTIARQDLSVLFLLIRHFFISPDFCNF